MKATSLTLTLAAALAVGTAAPAYAQYVSPEAEREYRERVDDYNDRREDYEERVEDYQERRQDYAQDRAEYERQRAHYEREKAEYDRRYGWGAYERRYGAFVYRNTYDYDRYGSYDRYDDRYDRYDRYDDRYDRSYRGYDRDDFYRAYRDNPCERRRDSRTAAGAVIGALAGAAIGSNLADDNVRSEGAVLGAVVGGALGAGVGRSTANCDSRGYYYSYSQTYPYREAAYYRGGRSGRYNYDWYARRGCRLAVAPAYYRGRTDYRYVRVCPDSSGRYRITD